MAENTVPENEANAEAASVNDGNVQPAAKKTKKLPIVLGVVAAVVIVAGVGFFIWHQQPSFCATMCHDTMGTYLETYENSDYLVHAHAESGLVCLDCHEPTLSEQLEELQIQMSGDYRTPLAKRDMGDEFCLTDGCHTRDEIIAAGDSYVTPKGDAVNPHKMTIVETAESRENPHNSPDGEPLACSTCHTAHRQSKEINYCFDSCHHVGGFDSCSNCH